MFCWKWRQTFAESTFAFPLFLTVMVLHCEPAGFYISLTMSFGQNLHVFEKHPHVL